MKRFILLLIAVGLLLGACQIGAQPGDTTTSSGALGDAVPSNHSSTSSPQYSPQAPPSSSTGPFHSTTPRPSAQMSSSYPVVTSTLPSPPLPAVSCSTTATRGFVPTKLIIDALGKTVPLIGLPLEPDFRYPAVPLDGSLGSPYWTGAWFMDGAAPGAVKGTVIVSVHSYKKTPAIGNIIEEGRQRLRGTYFRLTDGNVVQCYKVLESKEYTEETTPLAGSNRELFVITCTSASAHVGVWEKRMLVRAAAV